MYVCIYLCVYLFRMLVDKQDNHPILFFHFLFPNFSHFSFIFCSINNEPLEI